MNRNGIALFVLMFAVLCLSVFALISFSSSRADSRTAEAGARLFKAYYEADALAERILARLEEESVMPLNVLGVDIKSEADIFTGEDTVSFSSPVVNSTELYVKASLRPDGCRVLEWRLMGKDEWVTDDNLPVWQGEEEISTGLPPWLTD